MSEATKQVAKTSQAGFPFLAILSLILVIAKLAGHFPHSWWIVFLPMYGPLVAIITILLILFMVVGAVALIVKATEK